ncbi:Uncharacterized protein TCM_032166 [Theobroma cacao]|uniref:Uncharacterized protein n=1 Tax=Theobroma cacao TaxID=3641 RepID=A0A061F876_THECC|nr:Uncharacterized protein TCM_032166 [Theobroma cacao]
MCRHHKNDINRGPKSHLTTCHRRACAHREDHGPVIDKETAANPHAQSQKNRDMEDYLTPTCASSSATVLASLLICTSCHVLTSCFNKQLVGQVI